MHNKNELTFHSKVRKEYYNQLEKLFFFNENQYRYYDRIMELVEKYGEPYIEKDKEKITIKLEKIKTECLFASIGPELVGVLVYKFNNISNSISVIHIAVEDNYSNANNSSSFVLFKMIEELRKNSTLSYIILNYLDKKVMV